MKLFLIEGSLGYAGTDFAELVEGESEEKLYDEAESAWRDHCESSGAVYVPDYEDEMSDEELEELCNDALHGMVCHEMDVSLTEVVSRAQLEEADYRCGLESHELYKKWYPVLK